MKKTGFITPLLLGILTGCVTTSEIKQYDFSFSSIGEGGIAYADCENVILTSFSFNGKNPNGTQVDVKAGEYTYSELIVNSSYETFTIENLNEEVSDFTISLSAQSKAFYFDTLTITCITSSDSTLQLKTDNDTAEPAVPGQNGILSTKYAPISKEEYYQDVDLTLTGDALKNELNSKISVMTKYSYGDDTDIMLYTDANPNKPGFLYGIYDGDDIIAKNTGIWNKDHVWACSQMGLGGDKRPSSDTKKQIIRFAQFKSVIPK